MYNLLKKMLKTGVVTTKEPFKSPPSSYRGTIVVNYELCTHCQTCVHVCPVTAISYKEREDESFALLEFDYAKCMYCSLCVENGEEVSLSKPNFPKWPKQGKEGFIKGFNLPKGEGRRAMSNCEVITYDD